MSDPSQSNGALHSPPPEAAPSLVEQVHNIQHDVTTLAADVGSKAADVERFLTDQVQQRPLTTVGLAAGIGCVLGSVLNARLAAVLLGTATRVATTLALSELSARLARRDSTTV